MYVTFVIFVFTAPLERRRSRVTGLGATGPHAHATEVGSGKPVRVRVRVLQVSCRGRSMCVSTSVVQGMEVAPGTGTKNQEACQEERQSSPVFPLMRKRARARGGWGGWGGGAAYTGSCHQWVVPYNRRAQKRKEGGLWTAYSRGQSAGARWQS
jgi:hypothetical protein